MPAAEHFSLYAITAPGLEPLVVQELHALGVGDAQAVRRGGGVTFTASLEEMYAANLHLRVASRVVVRVASFRVTAFRELERAARRIAWERYVTPGDRVRVRVTCRKSRLYHSDAVAERIADAVERRVGGSVAASEGSAEEEGRDDHAEEDAPLFVVRLSHDICTVSADSSGALLHRRGYRQAVSKAPLRETLAAAVLMAAGWDGTTPLLDPMCGSGTIAIEGALLARRMAPGRGRRFAFMRWPEFDPAAWARVAGTAREAEIPSAPCVIKASDRDAGATAAGIANAERAGVREDIEFRTHAISGVQRALETHGLLATNPPYGSRVGNVAALRNLYAQLGKVARSKCPGWRIAMLSAERELERQVAIPLAPVFATGNGGIPVRLMAGFVPELAQRTL